MNSRERVKAALAHKDSDRVPFDLGATPVSGISAPALAKLRLALGLKDLPVKVHEPFQMLGFVEDDVIQKTGVDVIGLWPRNTFMGYENKNWKEWGPFHGTTVLVGEGFAVDKTEDGGYLLYPQGDRSVPPSARMPNNGYYFDVIVRQEPYDENNLNGRQDFGEQFELLPEDELKYCEEIVNSMYENTDLAIIGNHLFLCIGDAAQVPGPGMKKTPGIRRFDEWYMAHLLHPEYIKDIYGYQTELALKNLQLYKEAVGDKVEAVIVSGTDFGTQKGEIMSADMFREFYKPYFRQVNDWIHENTNWKTFYHCCGSIMNLLDDFVDMGADILNPLQCTAANMDIKVIKEKYGDKLTFWGGGVNVQQTLPFGRPEEVYEEVKERLALLSCGGGFVCASVHNIQATVPTENIVAFIDAINDYNKKQ